MHNDYRKTNKTGSLGLSQSKARNLATGIGQSADAAMYTGEARARKVVDGMPAKQKAALCKNSGYPSEGYGMSTFGDGGVAMQTRVDGKVA